MDLKFERVLMHLRKSRADMEAEARGEGETLSKHEKFLLKFAKDNNIGIINIRKELESGESLIHRPIMLQTLHEVEEGLYDGVLCMDIDRLGRGNMQDQGVILDTFKKANTRIITPRKVYNLNDEWDEEYSEFEAFMARKELKFINRRLQRGRLSSIDAGNYLSPNPPYGFLIESKGKGNRYLIPHPDQAPVVKMVFDWYTTDDSNVKMGTYRIANELNRLGYPSPKGKSWDASSIQQMLKNIVYAGVIRWRKKEVKKSIEAGKKKDVRTRPQEEWVEAKGKHEPLISMNTFQKAQSLLKNNYHAPCKPDTGLVNPLAGLIRCDMCGASMIRQAYKHQQYPHNVCQNNTCSNKSTRLMYVEDRIIKGLEQWLHYYKTALNTGSKPRKTINTLEFQEKTLQKLQHELSDITKQKGRLHDFLEQGIYDTATYLERSNVLAERLDAINNAIQDINQKIAAEKNRQENENELVPRLEQVLDLYYKTEDPAKRNTLLKSVLHYATYRKEKNQKGDDFTLTLHLKLPKTPQYPEAETTPSASRV